MGKQKQIVKNIKLSAKFATYLEKKPELLDKISSRSEHVLLSADDKELNKLNEGIIKSLIKAGKGVVKIQETKNPKEPWKIVPATS